MTWDEAAPRGYEGAEIADSIVEVAGLADLIVVVGDYAVDEAVTRPYDPWRQVPKELHSRIDVDHKVAEVVGDHP